MKKNLLFSVLALALLWVGWIIAYFAIGNAYILPSFWETLRAAGLLFARADFWAAFGNTFLRTLWAFLASFAVGVLCAVPARLFPRLRAFLAPVVSVLRTLPTMAVILILLLWTSPAAAPVVVASLVLAPAVYSAALTALDGAGEEYGELAAAYGVSKKRLVLQMYLPLAAPALLSQAGAILSMGLKITVSAEVLASTYCSLGYMMQNAKLAVEMPELLALTLLAVLLGFLLEGACALISKKAVKHA